MADFYYHFFLVLEISEFPLLLILITTTCMQGLIITPQVRPQSPAFFSPASPLLLGVLSLSNRTSLLVEALWCKIKTKLLNVVYLAVP